MDQLLKLHHQSENSDFISLFLPGFPGEYKDRPLLADLNSYNSDIYSLVYPGTYHNSGEFSVTNAIQSVRNALKILNALHKPILLVCYSFSTLFLPEYLEPNDHLLGILAFSPITDLKNCINEDFLDTLKALKTSSSSSFNINLESFEKYIYSASEEIYQKNFNELEHLKVPLFFFLGEKDSNVKIAKVSQQLNQLKISQKLIYFVKEGEHRLDSLYQLNYVKTAIQNMIKSQLHSPSLE